MQQHCLNSCGTIQLYNEVSIQSTKWDGQQCIWWCRFSIISTINSSQHITCTHLENAEETIVAFRLE